MNWYKKAQFTEKLDEGLLKDIFYRGREKNYFEKKHLDEDEGEDSMLPKDEDLRYFEDALNQPIGETLNDEERAKLIEKMIEKTEREEREKGPEDRYMEEQRREYNRLLKRKEIEEEFQLYWAMHKDEDPTFKDFLIEKGYGV